MLENLALYCLLQFWSTHNLLICDMCVNMCKYVIQGMKQQKLKVSTEIGQLTAYMVQVGNQEAGTVLEIIKQSHVHVTK